MEMEETIWYPWVMTKQSNDCLVITERCQIDSLQCPCDDQLVSVTIFNVTG